MNLSYLRVGDLEKIKDAVEAERAAILAMIQDAIDAEFSPSSTATARSLFYRVSARGRNT